MTMYLVKYIQCNWCDKEAKYTVTDDDYLGNEEIACEEHADWLREEYNARTVGYKELIHILDLKEDMERQERLFTAV